MAFIVPEFWQIPISLGFYVLTKSSRARIIRSKNTDISGSRHSDNNPDSNVVFVGFVRKHPANAFDGMFSKSRHVSAHRGVNMSM